MRENIGGGEDKPRPDDVATALSRNALSLSLFSAGHRDYVPHYLGGAVRRHDADVEAKAVAGIR